MLVWQMLSESHVESNLSHAVSMNKYKPINKFFLDIYIQDIQSGYASLDTYEED
jgi:hypothetical protein